MKDIIVLQELIEELRKSEQENVADALEKKTMDLYLMRLPKRVVNEKEESEKN